MAPSDYDVIVTGAGIAGLTAALFLARAGRRVLVLEANHQAGGLMAGVRRKGYAFEVGDQSFENLGIVFPLLAQLGLYDPADWKRARYQIRMPDIDVVVESLPQTEAAFCEAFPQDAAGVRRVFAEHGRTSALIEQATTTASALLGDGLDARALARTSRALLPRAPRLLRMLRQDFGDWYRERMAPGGLRDVLSRCGYTDMSAFIASAFWHLWAEDYWCPRGGLAAFFERLVGQLRAWGGELRTKCRAARYIIEGGAVRGVLTAKGERIEAPFVIHTGDLRSAVFDLIGPAWFSRRFLTRLRQLPLSDAMVSLYLGINIPPCELRRTLRASHLFHFSDYRCGAPRALSDPDYHRGQLLEVTGHSLYEDGLAPPGKTSLVIQAFSDMRWAGWDISATQGKARYRAEKRRVGEQMLADLEPVLPGLSERVEWFDVGAPPAAVRFTGNSLGATCGFALNLRGLPFWPAPARFETPIRNLLWAGHYTLWPGSVPTAALSGKLAAARALAGERRFSRSWRSLLRP